MVKDKLIKYHNYTFVLLIFAISIQGLVPVVPNIALGLVIFTLILLIAKGIKSENVQFKNILITYLVLLLYVGVMSIVNGSIMDEFTAISRYIIPGLLLFSVYYASGKFADTSYKAFIFGTIISIIFSCFNLYNFFQANHVVDLSTGKHIDDIIVGGRVYMSYSVVLSSILCLFLYINTSKNLRWLYVLLVVLQYLFLLIISARLALGIITLFIILFLFKRLNIKFFIASMVGLLVLITTMFSLNPNLRNRFLYADKNKEMVENFKQWEPRWVIWQCNYNLTNDPDYSILFGFDSYQEIENKLLNCYSTEIKNNDSKVEYFLREKFNSHNQFFDFILFGGVILLTLFLVVIVQFFTVKTLHWTMLYMLFALMCMFLVENLFHRQHGAYLVGMVFSFIALNSIATKSIVSNGNQE